MTRCFREFYSGCKDLDNEARSGMLKLCILGSCSDIEANLVSCFWRISNKLGISKSRVICHLWGFGKNILSGRIVPHFIKNIAKLLTHPSIFLIIHKALEAAWWCNSYCHKKWTWWPELKPWMKLFAFHIVLVLLHCIQPFFFQLWREMYPCGVMVKMMDYGIVVSEFELQSHYYIHFRTNTLRKVMNPLVLQAMG